MKRHWYEWSLAICACVVLATGTLACQGDSGGGSGASASGGETGPRMNIQETFNQVAGWFPADTVALGFMDNMDDALGAKSVIPPTSVTGLESGEPGTPKGMANDLDEMMSKRFGINPTKAKGLVFGGGMSQQTLILLGDFSPEGDAVSKEDVAGTTAYKFPTKNFSESLQELTDAVWATQLDGEASGLAFFRSKDHLKTAVEAKPSSTLEEGNFRSTYDKLVQASSADGQTSRITVVSPLGELPQAALIQSQAPFPLPKGLAVNIGSSLEVTATGEKKNLDKIEDYVENNALKVVDSQITEYKDKMNSDKDVPAGEMTSTLVGYHFLTAFRAQLDPQRKEKQLTYSVELPFSYMSPVATIGVLSGIAVPAFQKYLQASRQAARMGGLGGGGMGGGGSMGGGGMGGSPPQLDMGSGSQEPPTQEEIEQMQKKLKQKYGE